MHSFLGKNVALGMTTIRYKGIFVIAFYFLFFIFKIRRIRKT